MKLRPTGEVRPRKARAADVLGAVEHPITEPPWTVEQLDVLEAASKARVGERELFDRVGSSATLALVAPERLDPAKVERNLVSLRMSLRSREGQLADSKELDPNLLTTYFEYLFCLSVLRPGERYVFERPELVAKLEAYFEHIVLDNLWTIREFGFYLTAFPEQRGQVEASQWSKMLEYVEDLKRDSGLPEGLVGLRLIVPDQFSQAGVDVQPAIEILQHRVRDEMKVLRLDPKSLVQAVFMNTITLALLTADHIEFNPQGGLVLERESTLTQKRPLPERSAI